MEKAVFIDRDGTLIKDVPYNAYISLIEFNEYAISLLKQLKSKEYLLIVISNQAGIAKGFFTIDDLEKMHQSIQDQLVSYNVQLNDFYYCPHFPDAKIKEFSVDCDCRKPKPGLIFKAANDYAIQLDKSWMIGDILNDVEAGNAAGCKTILLNNGNETEWILNDYRKPDYTVKNLKQAVEIISNEVE